jgi:hypothetical protein
MTDDFWDDASSQLAETLGRAGVIQEAVPFPLAPGTIYARAGSGWTILGIRNVAGVDALILGAGLLAGVPVTLNLYGDLTRRTVGSTVGAYVAVVPHGANTGAVVLKSFVPYQPLTSDIGGASRLARNMVSATVNAPDDLGAELRAAHGGRAFTFADDRGHLGNLLI